MVQQQRTASTGSHDSCIGACGECAVECERCADHCLGMGGEHAGRQHQTALRDCSAVCAAAVGFMARSSPHARHICGECAEVCTACAESCERLAGGDEVMTRCALACRRCAQECSAMAGPSGGRALGRA